MLLKLAFSHWRVHAQLVLAQVLLLTLATALGWLLYLAPETIDAKIRQDAGHIDLVIAPPTSPLQALLALVYHIDLPVGTLPASELDTWAAQPMVSKAYSIAVGDSYQGRRLLGVGSVDGLFKTAAEGLVALYTPEPLAAQALYTAQNPSPNQMFAAIAGAQAAQDLKLQLGHRFSPQHGLQAGGVSHDDTIFEVTHILNPTGTVLDQIILIPIEAVWAAHEGQPTDAQEIVQLKQAREVSGIVLGFRTPLALGALPRAVRAAGWTAASPALESQRLQTYIDAAGRLVTVAAGVLGACVLLSLGLSIRLGMQTRLQMAHTLRTLGASKPRILAVLLIEYISMWGLGVLIALVGLVALYMLRPSSWPWVASALPLIGVAAGVGLVICCVAAAMTQQNMDDGTEP